MTSSISTVISSAADGTDLLNNATPFEGGSVWRSEDGSMWRSNGSLMWPIEYGSIWRRLRRINFTLLSSTVISSAADDDDHFDTIEIDSPHHWAKLPRRPQRNTSKLASHGHRGFSSRRGVDRRLANRNSSAN